jgi:hypothetical protein
VVVRQGPRQLIEVVRPPFDLERVLKGSGGVNAGYLMMIDRGSRVSKGSLTEVLKGAYRCIRVHRHVQLGRGHH